MTSRPLPDEPLFTKAEAAAKLNMSVKALMEHIRAGRLRFINIGSGKTRKRHRFTSYNLMTFIENQKVRETPACQSTKALDPHFTDTTSKSSTVAFTALQKLATAKMQSH